jgi:hypothetical protein
LIQDIYDYKITLGRLKLYSMNKYTRLTKLPDKPISDPCIQEDKSLDKPFRPNNVYLIYSCKSLVELDEFLSKYGTVGYLRVIYDKTESVTDRTVAIMTPETFQNLCKDGYLYSNKGNGNLDFKITPFLVNKKNYPYEGHTSSLYIPVPVGFDYKTVYDTVNAKLNHLADWDIIPHHSWSIFLTQGSRSPEAGSTMCDKNNTENKTVSPSSGGQLHSGVNPASSGQPLNGVKGCYVSFNNVIIDLIVTVRTLLNDTYWPDQNDNNGGVNATSARHLQDVNATSARHLQDVNASGMRNVSDVKKSIFRCYWAKIPYSRDAEPKFQYNKSNNWRNKYPYPRNNKYPNDITKSRVYTKIYTREMAKAEG